MNSGSYFSNLMTNGLSYELDDTQPHDVSAVEKDGPAARKVKKRSRNFNVDEDKLLVSGWLNVSIDPIHETDQLLGTYWARISMRTRSLNLIGPKGL
jgi:hypothetical protein